jgi:hypothetical protein
MRELCVYIEDKYSALPAGSNMDDEFSQKQLEQLKEIFGTPLNLLSQRVDELSQQIEAINVLQIRQDECLCADMQNHQKGRAAPSTPARDFFGFRDLKYLAGLDDISCGTLHGIS